MKKCTTLWGWLFVSVCATAQTDSITGKVHELEGVTVTESMRHHTITSSAPLHQLDRSDMTSMGVTDMADALHRLPGITLRDYGGAGGMKTVSVRGFGAKHTGVSYDGVMISDCQSGEIDLSRYSLDNVDRLLLVIGDNDDIFIPARQASVPAILHIQTLTPPTEDRRPHLNTQLRVGSFGLVKPFVRYEQSLSERFSLAVIGEYTYADNDYPYTIKNVNETVSDRRTNSRMNTGHAEVDFVYDMNKANRLSGKVYYYDNDRQLPGQVHYYTNVNKESLRERNLLAQIQYLTHNSSGWSLKAHAKYNWSTSEYKDPLIPQSFNDASYWQRELYTSAALMYVADNRWVFDYSADYSYNNLNGSSQQTVIGRPFRHSILQSATAKYHSGSLTALARLLYSLYLNDTKEGKSAQNMRRLSPSVSLSWKPWTEKDLYVRASYKNIFRSPTFNESYYYHYGSPDLLPESTDQWNVGVTYGTKPHEKTELTLTLDGYLNNVKDMIVAVPVNMFVWTCVNVGKVHVLGLDATLRARHYLGSKHLLTLAGNYSYQRAKNHTNLESPYYGNQIAYMPEHTGSLAIGWENPWVNVSLHGSGISSRWSNNQHYDDTLIDGYWDTGLTLWRTFGWGRSVMEARMDVKNLFDRQYEIVRFYPMPGRSWMASVAFRI